eukprot:scaffold17945_cov136-Skeletonema_dohrnii-CCMP3373.AAC.7
MHANATTRNIIYNFAGSLTKATKTPDTLNIKELFVPRRHKKIMSQLSTTTDLIFTVPTKGSMATRMTEDSVQKKVIDTRSLKGEDLKTLKKQDPFLYFSIPALRSATLLGREVDMSSLKGDRSSRRASCPSKIESAPSTKIERRSRISFECHTDLILEGFIDDMDDLNMRDEFDFGSLLDQPLYREKQ